MRFRPWLLPAVLMMLVVAPSARADEDNPAVYNPHPYQANSAFDQKALISELQGKAMEPYVSPKHWFDIGVALPEGNFKDRNWDPGLMLRWSERVWREGPFSLVGSMGFLFNDDTRFNESQVDGSYAGGFDSFIPIESHRHISFPFAVELHLEPASEDSWSPFVSAGPAIQWTHEVQVRQVYAILADSSSSGNNGTFVVPFTSPAAPVPLAEQILTKSHFHPGLQGQAGLRFRMGHGSNPLHIRLAASANVWYEHSNPETIVSGSMSFGK
ncbi:MAG TPA: hypothetical protein VKF80_05155 [Candidatus Eisenbacteria bacterium]|nr:hypothetical protein [Candidatus Eisenbacteria bacterium]